MKSVWEVIGDKFENSSNLSDELESSYEILKRMILNLSDEEKEQLNTLATCFGIEINQMVAYLTKYKGDI